ncbi:tryptophan synthase alpha chain [Raphidocelis subcapitata]|uniref:Tryptophan synthase alpha chain n=1 Tax=Raphidocelis subcapitata TaxID=307507 RepID=A0A2V0NZA4_9CHLO|nr:tryptophan synthase alpha chain [Raphidocelis subcapitata]|eukprot:GBF90913.1 tryptophan synthase alpha chain [Raphidocelis subcapitata]
MQLQHTAARARASARAPSRRRVTVVATAVAAQKSVSGRMAELKANGKIAFIPFLCAGDPDLDTTALALQKLDAIGADVIELGVPYSDPLADGPVIHGAATRALMKGATLDAVVDMVRRVSPTLKAPLVLFTYFNPILRKGVDNFCRQIKAAGASGLLVPDIPLEETGAVRAACEAAGLELVLLATPTTPKQRMADIARASQGFVYLVSVTGVTGAQERVQARVEGLIELLHSVTDKSVAVGFGVSKPEHARQIVEWGAEGVICGSALVRALGEAKTPAEGLVAMEQLAKSLRDAIPH